MFGSSANQFNVMGSDLDLCLVYTPTPEDLKEGKLPVTFPSIWYLIAMSMWLPYLVGSFLLVLLKLAMQTLEVRRWVWGDVSQGREIGYVATSTFVVGLAYISRNPH